MKWTAVLRGSLVLGSLALMAGCEEEPLVCPEDPNITPQAGVRGMGGTNGLDTETFHKIWEDFFAVTQAPITDLAMAPEKGHSYEVSEVLKETFLKDRPERELYEAVFSHAMACALPAGVTLLNGDEQYEGGGILTTTKGWYKGPLEKIQAEDLFACMAVLLNPVWTGVPVFLSGPSVGTDEDSEGFELVEAVWTVDIDPAGRPYYHVWPILDVAAKTSCWPDAGNEDDPWRWRLCGPGATDCGLEVRHSFEEDCTPVEFYHEGQLTTDEGHFECAAPPAPKQPNGPRKAAIQTRLRGVCDLDKLFCPAPQ